MIQEQLFIGLLLDDKSVIPKPKPIPGGGGKPEGFSLKMLHVQVCHYWDYQRPHSCSFNLFIRLMLEKEKYVLWRQNPRSSMMF